MHIRPLPWAATVARLLLGGVFACAALSKITDPSAVVRSVRAYQVLPDPLAVVVGRGLPALELLLALVLIAGIALRVAAAAATGLLVVFLTGIVSADVRGLRIDCGCFGGGGAVPAGAPTSYTPEILRDGALLALAVGVFLVGRSRLALSWSAPTRPEEPGSALSGPERRRHRAAVHRYQAATERHARRQRATSFAVVAGLVLSAFTGVAVASASAPGPASQRPAGVTAAGGVVVGAATAPHTLVMYEDPQCPVCGQFERVSGSTLQQAVAAGQVRVEYRMRSFLGPESVRAVAALGAAQVEGRFEQLREALFAHQPIERTGGFTISDLLQLGAAVGLRESSFVKAVRSQQYAGWARQVDDRASRDGNTATPELLLDGHVLDPRTVFTPGLLAASLVRGS